MNRTVDIAIVGGGLVGLSLAAALARSPFSVVVIDAGKPPAPVEPVAPERDGFALRAGVDARVSALNPASQGFLARIGGWPGAGVLGYRHMTVLDSRGSGRIDFDAGSMGEPALGYIVQNRDVLIALFDRLEESDVTTRYGDAIERIERGGSGFEVAFADGPDLECELLIGADGGNSIVRQACGIRSLGWPYDQQAIVTTIETEAPHLDTARQWFTPEGPLAFLPLAGGDGKLCSVVWSSDRAGKRLELGDEAFCQALTQASERALGAVSGVERRFSFPLRQSQAFRYVQENLALAGDAAHTVHPLAGQGANLGLADAEVLASVLLDANFSDESIADVRVLRRYQRRRQPRNLAMAAGMEAFTRLYRTDNPAINWMRNAGTRFVDRSAMVKSVLARAASGR